MAIVNLKLFSSLVTLTAFALSGCSFPSTENPQNLSVSKELQFKAAAQGKSPVAVTQTIIAFPDERSYSATPPAFQPKECTLSSAYFDATVALPARVNLPSYGPQTPAMTVRCTSDKFEFDETFDVVNITQQSANAATAAHLVVGFGLVGAAATSAAASQRDKTTDVFGYPLKIELK